MDISYMFKNLVAITQFNKGKASQLFSRAQNGETLLVIKNNSPVAVILSPDEYKILRSIPKLCNKLYADGKDINCSEIKMLLEKLRQIDDNGDVYV